MSMDMGLAWIRAVGSSLATDAEDPLASQGLVQAGPQLVLVRVSVLLPPLPLASSAL
jgi:hypothetical protein